MEHIASCSQVQPHAATQWSHKGALGGPEEGGRGQAVVIAVKASAHVTWLVAVGTGALSSEHFGAHLYLYPSTCVVTRQLTAAG